VLLALAAVLSVAAFAGPPGRATLVSPGMGVICSLGEWASFSVGRGPANVRMDLRAGAKELERTALSQRARALPGGDAPVLARLARR
jgi:hypothetical protein